MRIRRWLQIIETKVFSYFGKVVNAPEREAEPSILRGAEGQGQRFVAGYSATGY